MIEEIMSQLYRIEIPLPNSPLKYINSYLIKSGKRCLIIDTGMNRDECREAMTSSIQKLGVDLGQTDFYITHVHSDHVGLAGNMVTPTSKTYLNWKEIPVFDQVYTDIYRTSLFQSHSPHGFPKKTLEEALRAMPGFKFSPAKGVTFSGVEDGTSIETGSYTFQCVETPGHSMGHMCLYEPKRKLLISGDHILFDITPHIGLSLGLDNPLGCYLSSLERIDKLDIKLILPGHRRCGSDHHKRIEEIKAHHKLRLTEIVQSLSHGEQTAYEITSQLTWDLNYPSWKHFPSLQKYLAVDETIAHLKYLEDLGQVQEWESGSRILFSPVY